MFDHRDNSFDKLASHWGRLVEGTQKLDQNKDQHAARPGNLLNVTKGRDGRYYGVLNEGDGYYVKMAIDKGEQPTAADFEYIGGRANRLLEGFNSLPKAQNRLNLKLHALTEEVSKAPLPDVDELLSQLDAAPAEAPAAAGLDPLAPAPAPTSVAAPPASAVGAPTPAAVEPAMGGDANLGATPGPDAAGMDPANPFGTEGGPEGAPEGGPEGAPEGEGDLGPEGEGGGGGGAGAPASSDEVTAEDVLSTVGKLGAMIDQLGVNVTPQLAKSTLNPIITKIAPALGQMDEKDKEELAQRIQENGKKLDETDLVPNDGLAAPELEEAITNPLPGQAAERGGEKTGMTMGQWTDRHQGSYNVQNQQWMQLEGATLHFPARVQAATGGSPIDLVLVVKGVNQWQNESVTIFGSEVAGQAWVHHVKLDLQKGVFELSAYKGTYAGQGTEKQVHKLQAQLPPQIAHILGKPLQAGDCWLTHFQPEGQGQAAPAIAGAQHQLAEDDFDQYDDASASVSGEDHGASEYADGFRAFCEYRGYDVYQDEELTRAIVAWAKAVTKPRSPYNPDIEGVAETLNPYVLDQIGGQLPPAFKAALEQEVHAASASPLNEGLQLVLRGLINEEVNRLLQEQGV